MPTRYVYDIYKICNSTADVLQFLEQHKEPQAYNHSPIRVRQRVFGVSLVHSTIKHTHTKHAIPSQTWSKSGFSKTPKT